MLGFVSCEWIGFRASGATGRYAYLADQWSRKIRRPWCGRVKGMSTHGALLYDFLDGKIDYGESNGEGTRGVRLTFYLYSGYVYKVHDFTSWRSDRDRFVTVNEDGDLEEITEEDAKQWAINEDWAKTSTKPRSIE